MIIMCADCAYIIPADEQVYYDLSRCICWDCHRLYSARLARIEAKKGGR